jgi:hypothetical protein
MADIQFDDVEDSRQWKTIQEGGIKQNFQLVEAVFQDEKEEKKDDKGKVVEKATKPMVKLVFQQPEDTIQFSTYLFNPPRNEKECNFFGDVYEGGVPIRKRTPDEEIKEQFKNLYYIYEQLGRALGASKDALALLKSIKGSPDVLFRKFFDTFFTKVISIEKAKAKRIDLKVLFNNNDTKKTSFLGLAKANATNMIFAPHIAGQKESLLQVTEWELKNVKRKYSPNDRAPQSNDTLIPSSGPAADDGLSRDPVSTEDLF